MLRHDPIYDCYCAILRNELQMATGCTEPIALAYCAAKARAELHAIVYNGKEYMVSSRAICCFPLSCP